MNVAKLQQAIDALEPIIYLMQVELKEHPKNFIQIQEAYHYLTLALEKLRVVESFKDDLKSDYFYNTERMWRR